MLLDTESKVAVLGEVLAPELVLLDLEAALEDLLGLEFRKDYIKCRLLKRKADDFHVIRSVIGKV